MSDSILIVDDEASWREQLATILRDEEYIVEVASDYIEALGQLRRGDFALLVVDLRLSDTNESDRSGMDLLSDAYDRQVLTIIVTGYGAPNLAKEAYHEYGVYDFISKDKFDNSHFRESVRKALNTHRAQQHPKTPTPEQKKRFDETIRRIFRGETIKF